MLEPTTLTIDPAFAIGEIDPRVFGSFVEHLGRCVYGGIYEPGSPLADEDGIRTDVIAASLEMGVTTVRYPGGNFVSNYDWRDGIGPRDRRPVRKDLAWHSLENNAFGTDEFLRLCAKAGWLPMMTCNLGTGTPREALEWFQYINDAAGSTTLAGERKANGHQAAYGAKLWCLGNEMDGPWQLGHKPPEMYAADAKATAKLFKDGAPETETVLCGSSGFGMATFADWDAKVLDIVGDEADYIALHAYVGNPQDDCQQYLFCAETIRRQIAAIDAVCIASAARRKSKKRALLSFDEWNVWYKHDENQKDGGWSFAPPLEEEGYNLEDAIVVSDILHALLERADVLRIANLAQLVNVIAPMLARRDGLLKQTTYYPFRMFATRGHGTSLRVATRGPGMSLDIGERTYVSATAVQSEGVLHLMLTNRSKDEGAPVTVRVRDLAFGAISGEVLTGSDPKMRNTWENPNAVVPTAFDDAKLSGEAITLDLPPMSLVALTLKVA